MKIVKRAIAMTVIMCLVFTLTSCSIVFHLGALLNADDDTTQSTTFVETDIEITPYLLQEGNVIEDGAYFYVNNVKFQYSNGYFDITNNSDRIVMVFCGILAAKEDGSYELQQMAGFHGIDPAIYNPDIDESKVSFQYYTKSIRPGETLHASVSMSKWYIMEDTILDIDNDGNCDLMFYVHPTSNEDVLDVTEDFFVSIMFKMPLDKTKH